MHSTSRGHIQGIRVWERLGWIICRKSFLPNCGPYILVKITRLSTRESTMMTKRPVVFITSLPRAGQFATRVLGNGALSNCGSPSLQDCRWHDYQGGLPARKRRMQTDTSLVYYRQCLFISARPRAARRGSLVSVLMLAFLLALLNRHMCFFAP